MTITLEQIRPDDQRHTSQLPRGEVCQNTVVLNVDGTRREFTVFVRADVLPSFDTSLVYGDALLEELLRFNQAALNTVLSTVGKYRRGGEVSLPTVLSSEASRVGT